jgi:hypothetical protein
MKFLVTLLFTTTLSAAPARYIVEFHRGGPVSLSSVDALREIDPGVRVRRQFTRALNGVAVELADRAAADAIARLPHVERVSVDGIAEAYGVEATSTNAPAVRRFGASANTGEGLVVAVIDTGIDHTHPALAGKVIGGYDFANDDADPMDDHRHGTHVAGIIAASGGPMTGVAPGVSLLAFKVLDEEGRGSTSDIVAGIERAITDGADIINLSLGKGGHPDDPMARAVENAVAAGIVVVVAAGNSGEFHTIGSPGVAHSAITVGATRDGEEIAEFSSRGPAGRSGAIKPDLVAPGVDVLSTVLRGGYARSQGTSMAAPYVAGAAALLLEQHPDWSPAAVKSALVNMAVPFAGEEVMTQGGGLVNLERAMQSDVFVTPSQVNFGLDGSLAPVWRSSRTITVRNGGGAPRPIELIADGLRITPSSVTLAPGETRSIEVAIDVDHETLGKPPTASFAVSGILEIVWDGGKARVPWAYLRAGRSIVTYTGTRPDVAWNFGGRAGSIAYEEEAVEALVEPGAYDIVAIAHLDGDVRVFVAEQQPITGDTILALAPQDAPYAVTFAGVDERGLPLSSPMFRTRLLTPDDGPSLVVPKVSGRTFHTTSFSERFGLYAIESSWDEERRTAYLVQYPVVRGLAADTTLRNDSSDLAAQQVSLRFSDSSERTVVIMPRDFPRGTDFGPMPETFRVASRSDQWTATVRMTPESADADFIGALHISVGTAAPQLLAPLVRRDQTGFFTSRRFPRPAIPTTIAPGAVLDLGSGPIHPSMNVSANPTSFGGEFDIRGNRGESQRDRPATFRAFDRDNVEVASGVTQFGGFGAALPGPGSYRAELRSGDGTMTVRFDTGPGVVNLQTLTSLTVLDGAGHHATRLHRGGNGSLVFSTSHETPSIAFRLRGSEIWQALNAVRVGEDSLLYGLIYRVDLANALENAGDVEIRIELVDGANSATWVGPAFTAVEGKRRAVRP